MNARVQSLVQMLENGERVYDGTQGRNDEWMAYCHDLDDAKDIVRDHGYTIVRSHFLGEHYVRATKDSYEPKAADFEDSDDDELE